MAISHKQSSPLARFIELPRHIAPLAVLRIVFGAVMLLSTVRFMLKGWVDEFYIQPKFHFTFYGFGWVQALPAQGMYVVFVLMMIYAALVMLGLFYRFAILAFFITFTYVELIDKTFYLNHYYFISIFSLLMALVPAHRYFSLDVARKPDLRVTEVPAWTINIFKLQLLIVYFFAGLSKLTGDWLLHAMPLKIWLPANAHLPVIGALLEQPWIAYFFSWFGAAFDLFIGFFLLNKRTIRPAYVVLVLFHIFTTWFFKIGMFPYIMMGVTLIFFPEEIHRQWIQSLQRAFTKKTPAEEPGTLIVPSFKKQLLYSVLVIYFVIQLLLPFRFLLYPGNLLWTEQGYRFSWRVMLMEKSGTAFFYVSDPQSGHRSEVDNKKFLTHMQEKMMATQPDMLLQYAHYLKNEYEKQGIQNPVVTAECYVTLNGSGSRLLADSSVNLAGEKNNLKAKTWILPFKR